jgi:AhpD family alkylhydroperoxidase
MKGFEPGNLDKKTMELVAIACTYMTRCPWCIEGHAKAVI